MKLERCFNVNDLLNVKKGKSHDPFKYIFIGHFDAQFKQ